MTILRWRMARAVLAGIGLALAAACAGPGGGALVTNDVSGCAAVLPLARDIVHDQGTLTFIRPINQTDADALARELGVTPPAPAQPHARHRPPHPPAQTRQPHTCLVVYHGNYPQGTIASAIPPAVAGHYTLMVLRVRHPSIDRILVTNRPPAGLKPGLIHF